MPLYGGTCPEHGPFERLLPQLGHPPHRVRCTRCNRNVPREPAFGLSWDYVQDLTGTNILNSEEEE